ncbi:response regulator [Confluentibacter flavum]|uniref:Response regulator n=1 Tax=Confluentibacter flavum TaxID=1909700 RepID=A0A2N3HIJ3_9FLAO|nr:response regulator [Confluentibacter flavum]PKQ44771.1 response regulator [Confluentibacter flavum]
MAYTHINILLADDDKDDCLLFIEALDELQLQTTLTLVHDGEQLMQLLLKNSKNIFDVLFLDLNMPRKNGFACFEEIKNNDKLKSLPVIIFSTSCDRSVADQFYKKGAHHYICKPADFSELRKIIQKALLLISEKNSSQPPKEKYLLRSLKS